MVTKERILESIRRLATENGGQPPGQRWFASETGVSNSVWRGKYWRTWSEALADAGFAANRANESHAHETLLRCMADLARQHRRFPTYADLRMAKLEDASFPNPHAFEKLAPRAERIELLRAYATGHIEYQDVLACLPGTPASAAVETTDADGEQGDGSVYLLKLGKHRQITLELPEKPDAVHVIATDDPSGIEAYWHNRFASKRTNGEWFALTPADVRAFKRRKFM